MRHLPNILSGIRIPLALLFPFLETPPSRIALLFFLFLSDFLDGFLARKYQVESQLGALLDPIGDKVLAISATTSFILRGELSPFHASLLFTRELALFVFFIAMKLSGKWEKWHIQSFWLGKITTCGQFSVFFLLVCGYMPPTICYPVLGFVGLSSIIELFYKAKTS